MKGTRNTFTSVLHTFIRFLCHLQRTKISPLCKQKTLLFPRAQSAYKLVGYDSNPQPIRRRRDWVKGRGSLFRPIVNKIQLSHCCDIHLSRESSILFTSYIFTLSPMRASTLWWTITIKDVFKEDGTLNLKSRLIFFNILKNRWSRN